MPESEDRSVTQLIRQAAHDETAWAQLWERIGRLVYAMAREHLHADAQVRRDADTSDVVWMSMAKLRPDKLEHVNDRRHLMNLLRRIVSGTVADLMRHAATRPTVSLPNDLASAWQASATRSAESAELLHDLLDMLPRRMYEVAVNIADGYSERETAERLGITRHEVRTRLEQAAKIWLPHLDQV